ISGRRILDISRRGKFLLFKLDDGFLLFHLRMSGDLVLEPAEAKIAPHHRLVFYLAGGRRLAFNDTRKFGRIWLVSDPLLVTGNLGPEPLDPTFKAGQLYDNLQRSRRQLKPLLMDQSFLAGMGNIYTDEALHRARLHPLTPSYAVSTGQAEALYLAIRQTLEEGIQHNGSSIDWVYRGGEFQNYFRVYGRRGQACPVCGTTIEKISVGQRGTHFCPACQLLKTEGK
ncbi:MAG: DNA-formamidopyrimidine glycosylase, partial [Chloroflexi bacterium RBG_16_54_18]